MRWNGDEIRVTINGDEVRVTGFTSRALPGRAVLRRAALTVLFVISVTAAHAQSPVAAYPAKLIRVVTGSSPGGGADVTARQILPRLAEVLRTQIIVDNRPGVAGMIANEHVSKAVPDGYTLLVQPGSFMMVSAILNAKGAWDPVKSLAPVIRVGAYGFVLATHPSVPAKTVKELIAVARAKPGALTFVTTGVGSNFHLAGELFKQRAKVDGDEGAVGGEGGRIRARHARILC